MLRQVIKVILSIDSNFRFDFLQFVAQGMDKRLHVRETLIYLRADFTGRRVYLGVNCRLQSFIVFPQLSDVASDAIHVPSDVIDIASDVIVYPIHVFSGRHSSPKGNNRNKAHGNSKPYTYLFY